MPYFYYIMPFDFTKLPLSITSRLSQYEKIISDDAAQKGGVAGAVRQENMAIAPRAGTGGQTGEVSGTSGKTKKVGAPTKKVK